MSKRDRERDPLGDFLGYLRAPGGAVDRNEAEKSPKQAEEDLAGFLRQFSFKSVCVACAGVSALRAKNEKEFSEGLAEFGLNSLTEFRPYLMRLVVHAAAQACPEDDVMGGDMQASNLMHALRLAEHVSSRSDQIQDESAVPFAIHATHAESDS